MTPARGPFNGKRKYRVHPRTAAPMRGSRRRNDQPLDDETGAAHRKKGIAHLGARLASRVFAQGVDGQPELFGDRSDESNLSAVPKHASPPRQDNRYDLADV